MQSESFYRMILTVKQPIHYDSEIQSWSTHSEFVSFILYLALFSFQCLIHSSLALYPSAYTKGMLRYTSWVTLILYLFYFILFYYFMCGLLYACMALYHIHTVPWRKEDIESPGTWVMVVVSHQGDAGNRTWVFCMNNKYF